MNRGVIKQKPSFVFYLFILMLFFLATSLFGDSNGKLAFKLYDVYGREVCSEDYIGVPLIVQFGACWCGGCQQEAQPLGKLADLYKPFGVEVIHVVSGENELTALEFKKHYRLPILHLLDWNREVEKKYNRNGWPFIMLVDRNGNVLYSTNELIDSDNNKIESLIKEQLGSIGSTNNIMFDNSPYMPETLKRSGETTNRKSNDRFPSLVCGSDGKMYVVFTRDCRNNSDVFMRVFDGKSWSEDIAVAATDADEFDGTIVTDKNNRLWLSWTSNAGGENYNIYVASISAPKDAIKPTQITFADDDAMHSRMVSDKNGNLWVTYYTWHKMGQYSRDKEIYVRKYDGKNWSMEIQVSPTDVPRYEDHSDPAIAVCGDGVIVSWSWDFHRPDGYPKDAREPTIFVRPIDNNLNLGQICAVSGNSIDTTPTVIVDNNDRILCAWDSLGWDKSLRKNRKCLQVSDCDAKKMGRFTGSKILSSRQVNVCTPCLASNSKGAVSLIWSENTSGSQWISKISNFDTINNRWIAPFTVIGKGNPRFPSIAYDNNDNLWVAYSLETPEGRKIKITKH